MAATIMHYRTKINNLPSPVLVTIMSFYLANTENLTTIYGIPVIVFGFFAVEQILRFITRTT